MVSKSNRWLWAGGLVLLLAVAAHVGGLHGQFVNWDDTTHITQNAVIQSLTLDHLRAMFTQPIAKLYIPLTWLSFAVDYQMWGQDPRGYHLTNLVLHVANSLLVLMLVGQLFKERGQPAVIVATLTAAIFAVHPLRVESVAWATERKDVLFVFFYLLALLVYLHWTATGQRSAYWCCFGLFCAAALSKSAAVTLPVVLLLLDYFQSHRRAVMEKLPFFLVGGLVGVVTVLAQAGGAGETVVKADVVPIWARLGLVGYCALFYVGKFVWPFHLSAVYPTFDELGWQPVTAAVYLAVFVAMTTALFLARRRAPVLWAGWLFYVITLSPTIGLVPVGIHVVADRFAYLPLLGLTLATSVGLVAAARTIPQGWLLVGPATAGVLVGLVVLSERRTMVWANTESLFQNAVAENPQCLPAHLNLAVWYGRQQRFDEAIVHGKAAVAIAPDGLRGRKILARVFRQAGRCREAVTVLRVVVDRGVDDAEVWEILGDCFAALGEPQNADAARQRYERRVNAPSRQ